MREQSAEYFPFADVRRCDMRVTLRVEALGAKEAASFSTSNGDEGLTADQLAGWVSNEISGEDGVFSSPPYIYASFAEAVSSAGITLYFGESAYPTSIRVTAYAADGVSYVARGTFSNGGPVASINLRADDYYSLKVEFLEMGAGSAAVQFEDIVFGLLKVYDKDSIQSATIINKAGFAGESLPSQQLTLVVDNSTKEYDLLNPGGIYKYFEDGQAMEVECIIDDEPIFMGTYYFQTASTPNSSLLTTIKGGDKILALAGDKFTAGSGGKTTLAAMVDLVLADTGISAKYEGSLASAEVTGAISNTTNKREALRLLAQAARCSCWINRDNELYFGALELAFPSRRTFTHDDLVNLGGFTIAEKVDMVKLTVNNSFTEVKTEYTHGEGLNVKSVSNPCVADGAAVAEWLYDCYQRRRKYKTANRGDPALEIGDTIMIYDPYKTDFYATITGITLKYNGGFTVTTEGVGPGKPVMVFPYYANELFAGELLNA